MDELVIEYLRQHKEFLQNNDLQGLLKLAQPVSYDFIIRIFSVLKQYLSEQELEQYNIPVIPESSLINIKLLSAEEAEKIPRQLLTSVTWQWLSSPGQLPHYAAVIDSYGSVYYYGVHIRSDYDIRPVITVSDLKFANLYVGDFAICCNQPWVYLSNNKFLYAGNRIKYKFDKESNDYEKSEIKQFVENDFLNSIQ